MTETHSLRLDVTDLRRRSGARRDVVLRAAIPDLGAGMVRVRPDVAARADLAVEAVREGIVVRGRVEVDWESGCARCLEPLSGTTTVHVDELFEAEPVEGETYLLEGDSLDLEQCLRDALVLEFPLAPTPPVDRDGHCTRCHLALDAPLGPASDEPEHDPRWDALRALEL